jgi:hypothetical protein
MVYKFILTAPCMVFLAACGGSSTSSNSYSDTLGNPATAFQNGIALKATEASAAQVNIDFSEVRGARVTELEAANFSLKKGDAGVVTMSADGKSFFDFTDAERVGNGTDGEYGGLRIDDGAVFVQVFRVDGGSLSSLIDGTSAADSVIVDYQQVDYEDLGNGSFGFAVLGATTNPSALGKFTTSSYFGSLTGEFFPASGFTTRLDRFVLKGDTSLTANFEKNTVSGDITNLELKGYGANESSNESISGTVILTESAISGNGFGGAAILDNTFVANNEVVKSSLTYSGNFYGNSAEEASGILQGTMTGANGDNNFVGAFRTTKN